MRRHYNRQSSGQVLVIAVLVVSLVLLSTQVYIYEVGKSLEVKSACINDFVFAVKLGSKHVVSGALANISNGGSNLILAENLERWKTFVGGLYQFGKPILDCTVRNMSPYSYGTYVSWVTDGFGISSAYVDFNFTLADSQTTTQLSFTINVTTTLTMEGVYRALTGDAKQINITLNLANEGNPALAKNFTILYNYLGDWLIPTTLKTTDYGNGTYLTIFEADIPGINVDVSTQTYDLREIYVEANSTCTQKS